MKHITYRTPSIEDGAEIWKMVDETAALDDNSPYAYLMACRNFAATSVVAEDGDNLAGMVTAYPLPQDPQMLFVWQVNVREAYKLNGIASCMLNEILKREDCQSVRWIETTIAPDNQASECLFRRIAEELDAEIHIKEEYGDEMFPDGEHQIERLFVIGPIIRDNVKVEVRKESPGFRLHVLFSDHEEPAFSPSNPSFSNIEDARQAAESVRGYHAASDVIYPESVVYPFTNSI
jgi:L-2,4-diaminobutyric acid acetyltransferase